MFVSIKMANGCFRLNILAFMVIKKYREFVFEKMKIIPLSDDDFKNIPDDLYKYHPETKEELKSIIRERIQKEGSKCDLNDIDTSKITDMSYLFSMYNGDGNIGIDRVFEDFNGDISKWDVSHVKDMSSMFQNAVFFNGDISKWNVGNVEIMESMFYKARLFNCNISGWNVSKVKTMESMFYDAYSFNADISGWDVSNVESMYCMFDHARTFNMDISKWDVSKVNRNFYMFNDCPLNRQPEKQPKFKIY